MPVLEEGEPLGFVISARVCLSRARAECVGHRHHHHRRTRHSRHRRRERREYKGVGVNRASLRTLRSVAKYHIALPFCETERLILKQ